MTDVDAVPDRSEQAEDPPVRTAAAVRGGTTARRVASRRWVSAAGVLLAVSVLAAVGLFISDRYQADAGSELVDDFDGERPDGLAAGGLAWEATAGTFVADAGLARVGAANEQGPRSLTLVDTGSPNVTLSVTAGTVTTGWGVVFRYVGPYNYWYLEAVPEFATFNVMRVADGQVQRVDSTKLTEMRDGMVVGVTLAGSLITVTVDEREIFRRDDDHAFGGTKAGLVASGEAVEAGSWDGFVAVPIVGPPAPQLPVIRRPLPTSTVAPAATVPEVGDTTGDGLVGGDGPVDGVGLGPNDGQAG